MPIDYRVTKLVIQSFRGIRNLTVDLAGGATTYLIGGNNSGKSTVLNAFAFALKGGGFHAHLVEPYDFFHNKGGEREGSFDIELHFSASAENAYPAVQGVGKPIPVHGIRVEGRTQKGGRLRHKHVLFDAQGDSIALSPRTTLSKGDKITFKEHGLGFRKYYARLDDIRDFIPEVWLLSPDNLYRSLYEWRTGPLQRLSGMLTDKFLKDEWELEYANEKRRMPETVHKLHEFFRYSVAEFPFWKDDLRPKLETTLSQYVGHQARIGLVPDIQTIQDWIAQQLQASFAADVGGPLTPLKSMGQGWQSLVRIAALDALSQYPEQMKERVAILYEEPETYLHPHLCRRLRRVLDKLAEQGWIVMCATHAPEFISFASTQSIVRLQRQGDEVTKGVVHSDDVGDEAKFQERLDEHGNHEMLFCHRAILCEGKDDQYALRLYLEKAGVDLDGNSISIIAAGSVGAIPEYARIASDLNIPWFAVSDEDVQGDGTIKPATAKARKKLDQQLGGSDRSEFWSMDLEHCLGIQAPGKARPAWQRENVEPKDFAEVQAGFPQFSKLGDSVKNWVESNLGARRST